MLEARSVTTPIGPQVLLPAHTRLLTTDGVLWELPHGEGYGFSSPQELVDGIVQDSDFTWRRGGPVDLAYLGATPDLAELLAGAYRQIRHQPPLVRTPPPEPPQRPRMSLTGWT